MTTNYWNVSYVENSTFKKDYEDIRSFLKEIGESLKKESNGLFDYEIQAESHYLENLGFSNPKLIFYTKGTKNHQKQTTPIYKILSVIFELNGFSYNTHINKYTMKYENTEELINTIKKDIKSEKIGKILSFLAKNSENEAE